MACQRTKLRSLGYSHNAVVAVVVAAAYSQNNWYYCKNHLGVEVDADAGYDVVVSKVVG